MHACMHAPQPRPPPPAGSPSHGWTPCHGAHLPGRCQTAACCRTRTAPARAGGRATCSAQWQWQCFGCCRRGGAGQAGGHSWPAPTTTTSPLCGLHLCTRGQMPAATRMPARAPWVTHPPTTQEGCGRRARTHARTQALTMKAAMPLPSPASPLPSPLLRPHRVVPGIAHPAAREDVGDALRLGWPPLAAQALRQLTEAGQGLGWHGHAGTGSCISDSLIGLTTSRSVSVFPHARPARHGGF